MKILVTRTDRLGDLVLSTPVFEALRKKFPDAHLAGLTFLENRAVVEGNPYLNEVIVYDKQGSEKNWLGNLRFARQLRKKNFDAVIHLHPTNRMHWTSWLAQIPMRIGYAKKNAWTLTHSIEDRKFEGKRHEAEYNFDLLKFLGVEPPKNLALQFPLKEKDRLSLLQLFKNLEMNCQKPYAVLNPSASCPSKIWPAARFARLADRIQEERKIQVAVISGPKERILSQKVKKEASLPLFDLSGKLSLGMLGWFLKEARILISNDSGPVHVARAVGTPVVSIFGRKQEGLNPKRWGPLGDEGKVVHKEVACPVCLAHECQINFLCLDVISVEEVWRQAEPFLK